MHERIDKKLRILYLLRFLFDRTDEKNTVTLQQIQDMLCEKTGEDVDRRQIYGDIHALEEYGFTIEKRGKPTGYALISRTFETAELKLLADAVQSSRFIPQDRSDELIRKICTLTSQPQAIEISRSTHISGKVKSETDQIYKNVDTIYNALAKGRRISFRYFNMNARKERVYRRDGNLYIVSPYSAIWQDDNYYLVAYDHHSEEIRHFRVDKMDSPQIIDLPRLGREIFDRGDMERYSQKLFGMFGGQAVPVRLLCDDSIAGVIIDRFGTEPTFFREGEHSFSLCVSVVPSTQFFGWILGLGDKVKIVSPDHVVEQMKQTVKAIYELYED